MNDTSAQTVERTGILDELSDITYELEMENRIASFADGGRLTDTLSSLWPIIEPDFLDTVEAFFETLLRTEEARTAIEISNLDYYKKRQVEFWSHMLTAPMDRRWGQVVSERGAYMHRIGLEPRFYLPAYAVIFDRIVAHLCGAQAGEPECLRESLIAVNRLNFLINEIMASTHHEMVRRESSKLLEEHGKAFEQEVVTALKSVTEAAERMRKHADEVGSAIEAVSRNSASVSDAADHNAENVRTAAAAAEELATSVKEVANHIKRTATTSTEARDAAEAAGKVIEDLRTFSEKIGNVIKLIDDIAGQTNLLALNATIEAARAGEAGRGFAVVANEVKALAGQTAQATKEITGQIESVQATTHKMIEANRNVRSAIGKVTEISGEISSMIDEQTSAISEITRSVGDAADRTGDVSSNIAEVSSAAGGVGGAMGEVRAMADEVCGLTDTLSAKVDGFLATIRKSA